MPAESGRPRAARARGVGAWVGAWVGVLLCGAALSAHAQAPAPTGVQACAACHGPNGNSPTPLVPSIAGQPRTFLENQLVLIREGLRDIPVMKGVMSTLTDPQIESLAKHYAAQTLLPTPGVLQPDKARAGADLARRALCGTCHLPSYAGQSQVPRLAGQQEAYLLATLKMYRDNPAPGRDTLMSGPLMGMTDADLDGLAHHLAHHAGPAAPAAGQ